MVNLTQKRILNCLIPFRLNVPNVYNFTSTYACLLGKCLYQVRNMTVVINSSVVFELLIFQFDSQVSILNFPQSQYFNEFTFYLAILTAICHLTARVIRTALST